MIRNEKEYRISKAEAEKFKQALEEFDGRPEAHPGLSRRLIRAMKEGLQSELEELQRQIRDYERLKRRTKLKFNLKDLSDLPTELIRARVAAGLTQTDLARRLGLKTQQIQKYEKHNYEMASFSRLLEIAGALEQAMREKRAAAR
ncbi:MAG: helix-turn-helix domain-containing protein [Blastocatellia bacterium]